MHGIAYNPVRDEIIVANPLAGSVLVFRGSAQGAEAPLRMLQGPATKFVFPHSVHLDLQNKEILVGDQRGGSILLFPWDANGNMPPLRAIAGPKTRLDYVVGKDVDPLRNVLVASNTARRAGQTGLFIFNRTDDGDVPPKAIISGPKTGILEAPWQLQIHNGMIFAAIANFREVSPYRLDRPREGLTDIPLSPWRSDTLGFIGVWDIGDSGDVPPRAILKGPVSDLVHPSGMTLNAKYREIIVSDSVRNGIFTFLVPQFF